MIVSGRKATRSSTATPRHRSGTPVNDGGSDRMRVPATSTHEATVKPVGQLADRRAVAQV